MHEPIILDRNEDSGLCLLPHGPSCSGTFVLIQKYRANQVLLRNGLELYVQIGVFGVPFYKGPTGWHFIPH